MAEQRTVLFGGDVQGVGFRATTARYARGFAVTGTVRNLPDGRVELVVEGQTAEIDRLLSEIRTHFGHQISDSESSTDAATGGCRDFVIRY